MRLIDAEELLIKLQWHCDLNCPYTETQRDVMCNACFLGDAKDYIDSMPTIDAEPIRHGEWRADEMSYTVGEVWCSVCKTEYYIDDLYNVGENAQNDLPNYCPHCGAKMDEGDKDELDK